MKSGKSLADLAAELTRQRAVRKDYIAPSSMLSVMTNGHTNMLLAGEKEQTALTMSEWSHGQLAEFADMPKPYYDRLRNSDKPEHKALFDHTVNTLMHTQNAKRLIRTLDGRMRSMHSSRFQPFDNYDLAEATLPAFQNVDAEVISCEVTDKRLYLKIVSHKVTYEVAKGDVVQAGLVISNSEIGAGSLKVEPLLFRLVCLNGMISEDASFRRNHVGKAIEGGNAGAIEFFADETREQTNKAVFMQIADIVKGTLTGEGLKRIADRMRDSKDERLTYDAHQTIELVAEKFLLKEDEQKGILSQLIKGDDMSKFGLLNAITRYSQDVQDYDRATELERLGGKVLELPKTDWQAIAG